MAEDFGFQRTNNKSIHINNRREKKTKKANSQKCTMREGKNETERKNGQAKNPNVFLFLQRL